MNLRLINWIWHVRGNLTLGTGQSSTDAFDRLNPLFGETGTSHQRTNDKLIFSKKDQAAQDVMSVFDGGTLQIDTGVAGSVLRYDLTSRALLFCFLAPLLFVGIAQFTVAIDKFDTPPHEAAKKHAAMAMNPIDKMLGAPAPDQPGINKLDESEDEDKRLKPTAAYILAATFIFLYVAGRIVEDKLVKLLFRRKLLGA